MKKTILLLLIQIVCATAGFAQSPPWKVDNGANTVIPARADLDVRWESTNAFPREVWMYQLLPNRFSPEIISNLMTLCSFAEKEKVADDAERIVFQSANHLRTLSISFASGEIEYETPEIRYSPTNLAVGVPSTNELRGIAKDFLGKLHINFADITGWLGTNKVDFSEPVTIFYVGDNEITNTPYRTVYFRRSVDGMPVANHFYRFNIGEHGNISKISIAWPNLKRIKSYPAISKNDVAGFLRSGDAVRGPVPTDVGDIDWPSIKGIAITKAVPSYLLAGGRLYPFLHLDVLVDTGTVKVKIGMACPFIDETKL